MLVFAAVVFISFLYLVSNGALDLGPGQAPASGHARSRDLGVDHRPGRPPDRRRTARPGGLRRMGLEDLQHNFLTGRLEDLVKWARRNSVWPATFGLACCAIEMMSVGAADFDISRFGHGGLPGLAPPGRPHDRGRPGLARRWPRCCVRSTTR